VSRFPSHEVSIPEICQKCDYFAAIAGISAKYLGEREEELVKKRGRQTGKERFTIHASLCGGGDLLNALGSVASYLADSLCNLSNDSSFGTMTRDLLMLLDWLRAAGCTHIAFESTGVYWRPIFNILEAEMTVLLVNAAHIKAVPGRKTDIKDAEWIADLLQHGLLRPSFIPPTPQRELRELTRLTQ
jgi:hypothetical protein